jgi:hypothetical protein
MTRLLQALSILVSGLGSVAFAEPMLVRIPAHTVGCSPAANSSSDDAAIGQETMALIGVFEAANLSVGAAEQLALGDTNHVKVCLQLGIQGDVKIPGIEVIEVPEQSAVLVMCGVQAAEKCQAELRAKLGEQWKRPIYAVPVLRWRNKAGDLVGDVSSESLIETAAGRQPLIEPDPDSSLEQTDWLFVAPM